MDELAAIIFGGGALLWFVLLLIFVLWVLLPFAVFGVKGLLREIRDELRKLNHTMKPTGDVGTDPPPKPPPETEPRSSVFSSRAGD